MHAMPLLLPYATPCLERKRIRLIHSIKGIVQEILTDSVVIELHQTIALKVFVPNPDQYKTGQTIQLFTHLQIREDAMILYGFPGEEEIRWFKTLLTIPNIGSKTALNLLSVFTPKELVSIIIENESHVLTKASGVGSATAKKIALYMSEKLKKEIELSQKKSGVMPDSFQEAKHILMDLGLTSKEANHLMEDVFQEEENKCKDAQFLVKEALKRRSQ